MPPPSWRFWLLVLALLMVGCLGRFEGGEESRVPDGPVDPIGSEPTGEIVVLGAGLTREAGWRLAIYPTPDGHCIQVEVNTGRGGSGGSSCGSVEEPGEAVTVLGAGTGGPGPGHIEGLARRDVSEVWVLDADGRRQPVMMFDLEEAGIDAWALFVIVDGDTDPLFLTALDDEGNELGRADVPPSP